MTLLERRRMLMSMTAQGGTVPREIEIVNYTVADLATIHTIPHHFSGAVSMALIIPTAEPIASGANCPISILCANSLGGITDYPNKLISNYRKSDGMWDYTASNQGWTSDSGSLIIKLLSSSRMPVGNYVIVMYKYN